MSSIVDNSGITRRTMVLFFIVDTSGSMSGAKIGSLNDAIRETVPDLKDLSAHNTDAKIEIQALKFDSSVTWLYPQPIDSEQFVWNDLSTGGCTELGAALKELNAKLSHSHGFMKSDSGSFAPVIILLSDGEPTDEYKPELEEIKKNTWFKHAIKVAIAIGNDANKRILAEFTGQAELVIEVHNKADLKKFIKFLSVTASQVNSRSSGVNDTSKQGQVVIAVKDFKNTNGIADPGPDEFEPN
jgi:uncharacterized protein YegL